MKRWIVWTFGATVILGSVTVAAPIRSYDLDWSFSYETIVFDTQSGWIEQGQYALKESGDGYYVCTVDEICSVEISLHEENLDFDISQLVRVDILNIRRVIDVFVDPITKETVKFDGDASVYNDLRYVPKAKQPKKSRSTTIMSGIFPVAEAAIIHDSTTAGAGTTNATSLSWSHVVSASGSNKLLVAVITSNDTSDTDRDVTVITYNGVYMSTSTAYASATTEGQPFYLTNPSTGSNTVSATFGGTVSTVMNASISFIGVDQTTPLIKVTTSISPENEEYFSFPTYNSSWWMNLGVINSTQDYVFDGVCRFNGTTQWADGRSGTLGQFGYTCGPILNVVGQKEKNLFVWNNRGTNDQGIMIEIKNASPIYTATTSGITSSGATVYGILNDLDGETSQDIFFNYGTAPGVYTATTTPQTLSSAPQEFNANLTGLSYSTRYFFRAGMEAPGGTLVYDSEGSFYTLCDPSQTTCIDEFTFATSTDLENQTGSWTAPANVTSADVACWGAGGSGGIDTTNGGGGGGGGAFASSTVAVTPSSSYQVIIGDRQLPDTTARAATSSFNGTTVVADGGEPTGGNTGARGGLASLSIGSVTFDGGDGGNADGTNDVGGGGGGAGGPHGAGNDGQTPAAAATAGGDGGSGDSGQGGTAGPGGNGGDGSNGGSSDLGGGGGGGSDTGTAAGSGGNYGAGGGGGDQATGSSGSNKDQGRGGTGRCTITYIASGGGGGGASPFDDTYFEIID